MITDILLFAGQSNMAGRGEKEEMSHCPGDCGMEYRSISAPDSLYDITDEFGLFENTPNGIDDGSKKTGSLVPALVKTYSEETKHFVIAVSASKGGSSINDWVEQYVWDAKLRLENTINYAKVKGYDIGYVYMVWCQGETDGDNATLPSVYKEKFMKVWKTFKAVGAEHCFVIEIGHFNYPLCPGGIEGKGTGKEIDSRYTDIREAQKELMAENADMDIVASFEPYFDLMKDAFHYHQQAYNEVGASAGMAMARVGI